MQFEKKNLRVLPQDSDSFAIINWETYVRYCEEGELGFMEMLGFSFTYFYEKQKVFSHDAPPALSTSLRLN